MTQDEALRTWHGLRRFSYLAKALDPADIDELVKAFRESDNEHLKPIYERFEGRFSFLELKLARLLSW